MKSKPKGAGRDLSPALPKWEGGWSVCRSGFVSKIKFRRGGFSFAPLGETGEGFEVWPPLSVGLLRDLPNTTMESWDAN